MCIPFHTTGTACRRGSCVNNLLSLVIIIGGFRADPNSLASYLLEEMRNVHRGPLVEELFLFHFGYVILSVLSEDSGVGGRDLKTFSVSDVWRDRS